MEQRDEFTDVNALVMLAEKSGLAENSCRTVLRTLHRNGFVVKQIVDDVENAPSIPYGTIESLNAKFKLAADLDSERQVLVDTIKREWNDIQKKYMPIFNAIANAMGKTLGTYETFPEEEVTDGPSNPLSGPDARSVSGGDELSTM